MMNAECPIAGAAPAKPQAASTLVIGAWSLVIRDPSLPAHCFPFIIPHSSFRIPH
jgi:hypothetical protein